MTNWQPIEHAPKDGTVVDLWIEFEDGTGKRIPDCSWDYHHWLNGEPTTDKSWMRFDRKDIPWRAFKITHFSLAVGP